MLITKQSVYRHLIKPLCYKNFNIELVGSISGIFEKSYNDIDLLLYLPEYPLSEQVFGYFEKCLKDMGWIYNFSDEKEGFGIFHNYQKKGIGLDIFIDEKII